MSAIEVTITGVLYDKVQRTTQNVVLIGEASLSDIGVGGGPIIPEPQPPGIWPPPGRPSHPIARPPGGWIPRPEHPIVKPPLEPSHPIVLPPDKPTDPPVEPPTQPTDPLWKWVWNPNTDWIPAYVPEGGKPQPIPQP